jgi:hypothetical protein
MPLCRTLQDAGARDRGCGHWWHHAGLELPVAFRCFDGICHAREPPNLNRDDGMRPALLLVWIKQSVGRKSAEHQDRSTNALKAIAGFEQEHRHGDALEVCSKT